MNTQTSVSNLGQNSGYSSIEFPALGEKYHSFEPIGHGSQGTVFRAVSVEGKSVAIKVFDIKSAQTWKDAELFEREIDVIKNLKVDGVPKFIETVHSNDKIFLIEEFIDAPSLDFRLKNNQRFSLDDIEKILMNSAKILAALGSLMPPVVHRDIKPGNLLVDDNFNVFLVDFGVVASKTDSSGTMTFAGTAGYVAPEQLYGKISTASDIYSLGATLLHLVTGISPCDMPMKGIVPDFDECFPDFVPDWLKSVIMKMMATNMTDRIQSGNELIQYIEKVRSNPDACDLDFASQDEDAVKIELSEKKVISYSNANNKLSSLYSTKAQLENYMTSVVGCAFLFLLPAFLLCAFLSASDVVRLEAYTADWLPCIMPVVAFFMMACFGVDYPAPSDKYLRNNHQEYEENVSALNQYLKQALINPEKCKDINEIQKCPMFSQLKTALDEKTNIPLTPSENTELDALLSRDETITPCVAFPVEYQLNTFDLIKGIFWLLIYFGFSFIVVPLIGEFSLWWEIVYFAICSGCFVPLLTYFTRIKKYHKTRMENPDFKRSHELYTRRFLDECSQKKI